MNQFNRTQSRWFLAACLVAAAGVPPSTRGEAAADYLAEATRACRTLNTQFALGLRTREASPDELNAILAQGNALLLKAAGFDQDPLADHIHEWREVLNRTVAAIENAKATAVRAAIKRIDRVAEQVTIDPWAGPDQECGYLPEDLQPVPTNWDFEFPETDLGQLPEQIPPRFRLAEFLGLGRNRLHAELDWISPQLMRRKIDAEWGLHVFARMHCTLIGRFVPAADGATAQPIGDRKSLETFRIAISSQGLKQFITTRTGSDLRNQLAYRTEQSNDANLLRSRSPENPWTRENLAAAAAERGWRLQPATGQLADSRDELLDAALLRELASWQDKVAEAVRRDPGVIGALQALEDLRTSFFTRLQSRAARPLEDGERTASGHGSASLRADFYPELTAAAQLVAAGQLDNVSLARIAPLTARALAAARRVAWAAAAAPSLRTEAVHLSQALDALTAWTLP